MIFSNILRQKMKKTDLKNLSKKFFYESYEQLFDL